MDTFAACLRKEEGQIHSYAISLNILQVASTSSSTTLHTMICQSTRNGIHHKIKLELKSKDHFNLLGIQTMSSSKNFRNSV